MADDRRCMMNYDDGVDDCDGDGYALGDGDGVGDGHGDVDDCDYVDDDVEDEDEWEDGAADYGLVGNETDEVGPTAREIEGRRRQQAMWE